VSNEMKRWIAWGVVGLLVVAICLWAAGWMIDAANAEPPAAQKSIAAAAELPPSERMQQQLLDPRLDAAARESLMEKIEMAKNSEQQQSAAETIAPAPKQAPDFAGDALMKALPQVESGIFPGPEAMIRPSLVQVSNFWQGVRDGQIVMAFAGAQSENPRQGLVVIATTSLDPSVGDIQFETFLAPGETGSLRVVEEKNGVLALEARDGARLSFDLGAKSFGP